MIYKHYEIKLKDSALYQQAGSVDFYILDTNPGVCTIEARPLILVCAGGAYGHRSPRESEPVIMKFLAAGFHCALMNYSIAPSKWPTAALETAHAIALARENSAVWGIKPDAIFISGFSAGAHLAATIATIWNDPIFYKEFEEEESVLDPIWRPNGSILAYPVITMGEFTHEGSRENLLGELAKDETARRMTSMELRVNSATVPAFVWHTMEDGAVPVENSIEYVRALQKQKIPYELHIFEKGGHGLSLCNTLSSTGSEQLVPADEPWIDLAITWVKGRCGKLSSLE